MSSFVRRIKRMRLRKSKGAVKRMLGQHIGDKLGIPTAPVVHSNVPRALRRSKKEKRNALTVKG